MNTLIFSIILVELFIVSWIDIRTKKISNLWYPFNVTLALVFNLALPEIYLWSWQALIFPMGWLLVGLVLFGVNIMGAGDSKFLSSLYLIIPLSSHYIFLEKLLYSTIVVASVFLIFKVAKDFTKIRAYALSSYWTGLKESIRSNFSYAPVILLAWMMLGVERWA